MSVKRKLPSGFDSPTLLPKDEQQREEWQEQNRRWWESHPMRYDWKNEIAFPEFSREFYQEIDRRFFREVRKYLPWHWIPIDSVVDVDSLRNMDVLEIGVGSGSHAQLLASHARSYTGIDLTAYAVKSTSKRMSRFGLPARIIQMDAEEMNFPDASFDFIWAWGVIHHSANTARILQQMHRVLRPRGGAVTMVYHRSVWNCYVISGFVHGVLRGRLFKGESVHEILQKTTDGAIARYYTTDEWCNLVSRWFVAETFVVGSKPELFPLPAGRLKDLLMDVTPNAVTRFFLNRLGLGAFLVSRLRKNLVGSKG